MAVISKNLRFAATLASALIVLVAPSNAQSVGDATTNYDACRAQDDDKFRLAIRDVTLNELRNGTRTIDYQGLVRDQWRKHNLDRLIDERVKIAEEDVRSKSSWGKLLGSLASSEKANELAKAVAEHVYRSDEMKAALEQTAKGVSLEVGRKIVLTTEDAATPARKCLQLFLGDRFGRTIADTVGADAKATFVLEPTNQAAQLGTTSVAQKATGAITGGVILLIRRQLARMARRVGQRVVGAVIGRVASVVASGIGVALIAYDLKQLWELRNGVLPIIRDEMTSESTKAKVRKELADALKVNMDAQLETIADSTADHILRIWRDFKVAHNKVLELSANNKAFRDFVDSLRPDQVPRLDEIVVISLRNGTSQDVLAKLESGTLHQAINHLDGGAMQLARELNSVDQALAWLDVAGSELPKVIGFELHRSSKPDDFTNNSLKRLLSFGEVRVIKRLSSLPEQRRSILLELDNNTVVNLARDLDSAALSSFGGYLAGLDLSARKVVLDAVSATPPAIRGLTSEQVRWAVLASRDQTAAVKMMLRSDGGLNIEAIGSDLQLVTGGQVHPVLIWSKHPVVAVLLGIAVILLLLILRRLLFPPKRKVQKPGAA